MSSRLVRCSRWEGGNGGRPRGPLPQRPQLAVAALEPLAQQVHAGIAQPLAEGQIQLLQARAGAQHGGEVLAAGAGEAGVPQPDGDPWERPSEPARGPPSVPPHHGANPHHGAIAFELLTLGQRDDATPEGLFGVPPQPCAPPWGFGCLGDGRGGGDVGGCWGHSPQDAESAAGLLQPLAEQAHAAVAQRAVAQLQPGQAGVPRQQRRQLRAAALRQPAPPQPAGRAAENGSAHHTCPGCPPPPPPPPPPSQSAWREHTHPPHSQSAWREHTYA